MAIRLPLAFITGLAIYMIAAVMTVYDGALSIILQPIMGAIITAVSLVGVIVLGSPLLFKKLWSKWQRIGWAGLLFPAAGLLICCISWLPSLRIDVIDPETHTVVQSFHPTLATIGWFMTLFGIAYCPVIGVYGDRRWA